MTGFERIDTTRAEWQDAWERAQQRADDLQVEIERLREALTAARDIFKHFGYSAYADACDDALEGD